MESATTHVFRAGNSNKQFIAKNNVNNFKIHTKENNQCVVFCKKISPNVFNISNGFAVMDETKSNFNDGICMIAPSTKVVFVFE